MNGLNSWHDPACDLDRMAQRRLFKPCADYVDRFIERRIHPTLHIRSMRPIGQAIGRGGRRNNYSAKMPSQAGRAESAAVVPDEVRTLHRIRIPVIFTYRRFPAVTEHRVECS